MPWLTYRLMAIALPLVMMGGTHAVAQSNVLSILQDGGGNTLMVDQSDASGSRVGGLNLYDPRSQTIQLPPLENANDGANGVDDDGMSNNAAAAVARSVTMDVLGADIRRTEPARQLGPGNSANVTISGLNGFVGLLQDSRSTGVGNTATVNAAGGTALIGQLGGNNNAEVTLRPSALEGTILQNGSNNRADLTVSGNGATGRISQFGSGLNNSLNVSGSGTSAALIANGVSNGASGVPVTVESNGATVTITQSPM